MTMMVMAVALRETQKNGPRTNIVNTYYPGAEKFSSKESLSTYQGLELEINKDKVHSLLLKANKVNIEE